MTGWTAFIEANTAILFPPLAPEIKLHLATAVTPLWQATEAFLERTGLPPPYWAFAWPGGQALARHLLDRAALVRGLSVLDFAAGSAIAGIAAARAGAARVAATEIDPAARAAIAMNARLNDVELGIIDTDLTGAWEPAADVILAGDVCYEEGMAQRVSAWLTRQAMQGVNVLLADPGRAYLPRGNLVELARYRVPTSRDLEDSEERETVVWRWAAPGARI